MVFMTDRASYSAAQLTQDGSIRLDELRGETSPF
jgi:hypothetical protein